MVMVAILAVHRYILQTFEHKHEESLPSFKAEFRMLHFLLKKHQQWDGVIVGNNTAVDEHKAFFHHFIADAAR
jgi:hypothetical protein